ncbi:MAG: methyltransferase [Rhodobacterales bacterium]|nr:MAG: methyltransferase [Rhodobacterales bacterium]
MGAPGTAAPRIVALSLYAAFVCGAGLWRHAPYPVLAFALHSTGWAAVRQWFMLQDFAAVEAETAGGRERLLVFITFLGMVFLPVLAIVTPLPDHLAYPPFPGQAALGLAITGIGLWLFWRAHAELGTNWSPRLETRGDHRLMTHGIYARMRHPMYAAILVLTLAQVFLVNNLVAGPAGLAAFCILYLWRIDSEEAMMQARFGADYTAYCARTPQLIPRLGRWHQKGA